MKLSLSRSDETELPWLGEPVLDNFRRVGAVLEPTSETVDVVVVDDTYIRRLNRDFRDIDEPTDVISFSYLDDGAPRRRDEHDPAGEVYISHETVEREAGLLGIDPGTLFLRIGVHGLLHIVGFDHVSEEDASKMEVRERALLTSCLPAEEFDKLFGG